MCVSSLAHFHTQATFYRPQAACGSRSEQRKWQLRVQAELSQSCGSRHAPLPPRVSFLPTQEQWKFLGLRNSITFVEMSQGFIRFSFCEERQRKEVHRENNHVRVCRQQTLPALGRPRIRATAARSWRLNGRDTKLISVHFPPHSKHTAFGSYCCLLWEACGLAQMRCVNKKQSFLMLQRAVYIVTAVAGNVWFIFNIMDYMIMFSMCGSGGNGSQHLG